MSYSQVASVRQSDGSRLMAAGLTAALIVAALVYFQEGLTALSAAWQLPEYSHGPLIPLLSFFLFLRDFKALPASTEPPSDRWPGLLVVAAAILLGAVGKLASIGDIVAYAMIVFVGGFVLTVFGWRRGRQFWPAVLHLAFMLPLPDTLYWKVSTNLQLISSEFGVYLIRVAGIPVYLDGNIIDLGAYKLHVAEACSGLRYLYPILSFSYIFSALYRGPVWHKAVLLLAAAPITVVMNSVRIGIIGVIVEHTGIEHVQGITHLLEGWVIFLASVMLLFGLARGMLLLQRSSMTLSEALDLDLSEIKPQFMRLGRPVLSSGLIAATALIATAAVAWHVRPTPVAPVIERSQLTAFPATLGDWRLMGAQMLDPQVERVLAADDYHSATFLRSDTSAPIDLFIAWYRDQTKGGIHSPEVCLPSAGWEVALIERVELKASADGAPFEINRAIIQKGEERLMVYYWFEQYAGRQASDFLAKGALLMQGLRYGRTDGALVRMITPIMFGETPEAAEARLQDMLDPLESTLSRFVPRIDAAERSDR